MGVRVVIAEKSSRVTDADRSELRAAIRGDVLGPADFGYADACTVFNAAVARRPGAIAVVTGWHDVAAALTLTRRRSLEVSVRAGGHGVAGHAVAGDVVLDLSALRGVLVDPATRTAKVGAGTLWGELDAATQAHGLAVPGGRVTTTGVAGLTLGGGEGFLSRKHGLSCDNLLAAELVTADGQHIVASRDREPELFWALRGAGANFGVVISLLFRLHPLAPRVLGGMQLFRLADAPDVLAALERLHARGRDEFAGAAALMRAPAAAFVPGDVVGRSVLAVVPAYLGDPADGSRFADHLRAAAPPLADSVRPMSYLALQSLFDVTAPAGLHRAWSATSVPSLSSSLLDDLDAAAGSFPGPDSKIILLPIGGAVARPVEDTAVSLRDPSWLVHPAAQWADPSDGPGQRTWLRELRFKLRAVETGTYLNLDDEESRVRSAFGADSYRRLADIKAAWDPDDVFRHCAHISTGACS